MRQSPVQSLVVTIVFGGFVATAPSMAAEGDGAVESRGLNLPRVTVPAPPPPPPPSAMQPLALRTVGEGLGKITLPLAKACPPTCSAPYPQGTPIVLSAIPAPGSIFSGWSGDCHGTAPCMLKMDRPHTVEAKFNTLHDSSSTTQSPVATTMTPSAPAPIPIPYPNVGKSPLPPDLAAISTMLADGKPANTILEAWKGYVTRQVQAKQSINLQQTIQQVQRQAEAQVKARTDLEKARLSKKLNSAGDDAQLANVELQNALQKQQQTLQMMSSILKKMHDTASAIITNIRG